MFLEFFRWVAELLEDKSKVKPEVTIPDKFDVALWRCDTLQWESSHLYERYRDEDDYSILLSLSLLHGYYRELSNFYLYKKLETVAATQVSRDKWKHVSEESYKQAFKHKERLVDVKYALDNEGINCNFDVETLANEVMNDDE